jgi:hypothetical protein
MMAREEAEMDPFRRGSAIGSSELQPETLRDGELASLYGGIDETGAAYPLLVSAWEDEAWDEDSALDPQILAGLLRLAP